MGMTWDGNHTQKVERWHGWNKLFFTHESSHAQALYQYLMGTTENALPGRLEVNRMFWQN